MTIKIIAYALVVIAVILNFVIPAVMKKRGGADSKVIVRVKIAALAVAVAALIMVLFFVR